MTRVGVISRLPVAPGCRDQVLEALCRYTDEAREEGTGVAEVFVVSADAENPDVVWMHETYLDTDTYEDHFYTAARRRLRDRMDGLRGGPVETIRTEPVTVCVPVVSHFGTQLDGADWNSVTSEVT